MTTISKEDFDKILKDSVNIFVEKNFTTNQDKIKKYFMGETKGNIIDYYNSAHQSKNTYKKDTGIIEEEKKLYDTFLEKNTHIIKEDKKEITSHKADSKLLSVSSYKDKSLSNSNIVNPYKSKSLSNPNVSNLAQLYSKHTIG